MEKQLVRFIVILSSCMAAFLGCYAQSQYNLVPNYSFETHSGCPDGSGGDIALAVPWYGAVLSKVGGLTYFNPCSTSLCCGVPINAYGRAYQVPHSGVAYVGGYFSTAGGNSRRDYAQVKLLGTLVPSHCYYIEFYVNLSNDSYYGIDNVGLLVGDTGIVSYHASYAPANPQIVQFGNPPITDTVNWIKVAGVYTAHGGEQYVTIGNFKDDSNTACKYIDTLTGGFAAYHLDDVSVIPLDSMLLYADAGRDTTIYKGDSAWIGTRLCGLTNVVWYDSAGKTIATNVPGMWVKPTTSTYYIIEQSVCGQYSRDTVWVKVIQTVPVVIVNYQLTIDNEKNVLNNWLTVNEVNVNHYNVQRSTDGSVFNIVGVVKAKGSGEYSFVDNSAVAGVSYYRLEVVDKDGSKSYSKALSIGNYQLSIIEVYPNPTTGAVNIQLPQSGNWQVTATDVAGRLAWQQQCIGCGGAVQHSLTGSKGTYFIKVTNTVTGQQLVKKIILQ